MPQTVSSTNNTYLKITSDKIEPGYVCRMTFYDATGHFLKKGQVGLFELATFLKRSCCLGLLKYFTPALRQLPWTNTHQDADNERARKQRTYWISTCTYKKAKSWFVSHLCWHDCLLARGILIRTFRRYDWGRGWLQPLARLSTTETCRVISPPVHHPVEFLAVMFSRRPRQASLASV